MLYLHIVVEKTDGPKHQSEQVDKQRTKIAISEILPAYRQNRHKNSDNEHDSAHGRRPLLRHMPHRTNFFDGLSSLQGPQPRDQDSAQRCRDGERQHKTNDKPHLLLLRTRLYASFLFLTLF